MSGIREGRVVGSALVRLDASSCLFAVLALAGCRIDESGLSVDGAVVVDPPDSGSAGDGGGGAGLTGSGGAGSAGSAGSGGSGSAGSGSGGAAGCGPGNCTGCCSGDTCVKTLTNALCGANGQTCTVCNSCATCQSGACAVLSTSKWTLSCESAHIAAERLDHNAWDAISGAAAAPDPYCVLEAPAGVAVGVPAGYMVNTFDPVWTGIALASTTLTAAQLMSSAWRVSVIDCDGAACSGDIICNPSVGLTGDDLKAGEYTFRNTGSCLSLTVGLACAQ